MRSNTFIATLLLSFLSSLTMSTHAFTDPYVAPITSGNWYKPTPLTSWQWQISGSVNTNYDVEIYDIALFYCPGSPSGLLKEKLLLKKFP